MSYIVINDFRFGLDKRRLDLANRPGALTDLVNAHITQGGEIEKRKAFVRTQIVSSVDPTVITKGWQEGSDGIYVFGHLADPGGWPTGIKYQRLRHPGYHQSNTVFVDQDSVAISSIMCSTLFAGKIFAVVRFEDNQIFAFYDGTVLADGYYGLKLNTGKGNTGFLAELLVAINASGIYTGDQPPGTPTTLNIYGLVGHLYTITITKNTVSGTLVATQIDRGVPPIIGVSAVGHLRIVAGTEAAGHQITQIAVGVTNLLLALVLYNDSNIQTASDVATAINANTGTSGYRAVANAEIVTIFANAVGTTVNGTDVTVTAAGDVCVGFCKFLIEGTAFTLDYIRVDGINIMTGVLTFPTPPGETLTAFAVRVAAHINANTGVSGLLASSVSNAIYIAKAISKGSDADLQVLVGISGGTVTGEDDPTSFGVEIFYQYFNSEIGFLPMFLISSTFDSSEARSDSVTAYPLGGIPPYTYQWSIEDLAFLGGNVFNVYVTNPTDATTAFVSFQERGAAWEFNAICRVVDSEGNVGVSAKYRVAGEDLN